MAWPGGDGNPFSEVTIEPPPVRVDDTELDGSLQGNTPCLQSLFFSSVFEIIALIFTITTATIIMTTTSFLHRPVDIGGKTYIISQRTNFLAVFVMRYLPVLTHC